MMKLSREQKLKIAQLAKSKSKEQGLNQKDLLALRKEVRGLFDQGLELEGLDELLLSLDNKDDLKSIERKLQEVIGVLEEKDFAPVIPETKFPDKMKVEVINQPSYPTEIKIKNPVDFSSLKMLVDSLSPISKTLQELVNKKQAQNPGDFLPIRRVVKSGNKLIFDDSLNQGSGGGGGGVIQVRGEPVTDDNPFPVDVQGGITIEGDVVVDNVGVENIAGNQIDPATEQKQDSQITETQTTNTRIGSLTETAPASDTASSGLNGRLQRIAQRLTSLLALLPGSLGQKARAASLAVTLSSEDVTTLTPPAAITGFATSANQTTQIAREDEIIDELETLNSLVPSVYDYINLGYTGDNLTSAVFKNGGSGGSTISTLTLAYTGDNLTSVTKT